MLSKFLRWLPTQRGREVVSYYTVALSIGVFCVSYIPHTLLVDHYKDFVQLYSKGMSVPVSQKLKDRFQRTIELVEIHDLDKEQYKPFSIFGFDIFSAGSVYSRFGVFIGLPVNFAYEDPEKIDKSVIKINNESVVWDSEEGEALLNSLVLSENAQMYAMGREIKLRSTPKLYIDSFLGAGSVFAAYGLGSKLNKKFDMFSRPPGVRGIMYALILAFVGGNYIMWKDFSQLHYEEVADRELKKIPELAEGGKEFYTKILQRNIALRKLMGKTGESIYSVTGNENTVLRIRHVPLMQRKVFFDAPISA